MQLRGISSALIGGAVLVTLTSTVDAFWRMECRARSGLGRIDPLMNPGEAASHAHAIHGSNGFGESATYESLRAGDCTSCSVAEDKSAYWTPSLHFRSASGEFTLVEQVGGMLAYYLLYSNSDGTAPKYFPEGFQMIAGDNFRRNFSGPVPDLPKSDWAAIPGYTSQESLAEKAIGFNCLNYAKAAEGSLYRHFLPDKAYLDANCADGVRFELMFPSCWNGKDVDSPDHKSHVAYPSLVMTGDCPSGYETRLVSLFYETIWNTAAFVGQDGEFVISNGDPTGYGYHGDFMMGWDTDVLEAAVSQCTDASGEIEDCPVFTIQEPSVYDYCNITTPKNIENDDVLGPAPTLPGNLAIQSGPAPATAGTAGSGSGSGSSPKTKSKAATTIVPTLSYSQGSTVASSATFVPGAIFLENTSSGGSFHAAAATDAPSSTSAAAAVITSPAVISDAGLLPNQQIYSTSWTTSGREVLEVVLIEETVDVQVSTTVAAHVRRSHLHRHAARHGY